MSPSNFNGHKSESVDAAASRDWLNRETLVSTLRETIRQLDDWHMNAASRDWLNRETLVSTLRETIRQLDDLRMDIVSLYERTAGGSIAEVEMGELLQAVRKALVRLRKARDELTQQPLALAGGDD